MAVRGMDRWDRAWLVAIFLLGALWSAYHFYPIRAVPLKTPLRAFPTVLGQWWGEDTDPQVEPFRLRDAQEELARIYQDDAGHAVRLYIGYYESQEEGRKLISDLSKDLHSKAVEVTLSPAPRQAYRVNRVSIHDAQRTRVALYWYDLNGRVVANPYQAKLVTALDALTHGRTNGAIVAVSVPAEEPADANFIRELILALPGHLPRY